MLYQFRRTYIVIHESNLIVFTTKIALIHIENYKFFFKLFFNPIITKHHNQ